MKVIFTFLVLLSIVLVGIGGAQAQGSVINGVVYDKTNGLYHISFFVDTNDSVQPVIIAEDWVEEMDLHNQSLLDQEIYYTGPFYSHKPGGYLISVDYPIEKRGKNIPSIALVDEEGRTVDRISTHALGDWTTRSKSLVMERRNAEIDATEVREIYTDLGQKVTVFFNVSQRDVENAPVVLSVTGRSTKEKIFEFPVSSSGMYKIDVRNVDDYDDISGFRANITDHDGKTLSSGTINLDRSVIGRFIYYPGQDIYVAYSYLRSPVTMRVCDKSGNLIEESGILMPQKDSFWIIPADKMESNQIEMIEDGWVVSSAYSYQAVVDKDSSLVDFSLRLWNYSTYPRVGRFDAFYSIPSEYRHPEVIEATEDSAIRKKVVAGQTYVWSQDGTRNHMEYMYVILLDDGKVKAAERARVVSFTWGFPLRFEHVHIKSPGLQEIIENAVPED